MDTRKALDSTAVGIMVVLCVIWSLQQISLKAVSTEIAPMLMIALRSGVSAILVLTLMKVRGERPDWASGRWRPGLLVGGLFALEFLFLGEGLRHTYASHMSVFLYTAPIFAAIGLHWKLPSERMHRLQWAAIGVAFVGVAVAFLGRGSAADEIGLGSMLWGDFLGLIAGMSWGATTVVVRTSSLSAAPASETLLYQLVGAFVILTLAATLLGQGHFQPTPRVWVHLAFQGVVVSFASFLVWFWLLRTYQASRLGVLSFMTPVFSVLFGAGLLNEHLDPSFLLGGALVLAGLLLVTGRAWWPRV